MRARLFTVSILLLASGLAVAGASTDCTFLNNPDEFTDNAKHRHQTRSDLNASFQTYFYKSSNDVATVEAATIPHKNFIDDSIFARMASANIPSAPLASD